MSRAAPDLQRKPRLLCFAGVASVVEMRALHFRRRFVVKACHDVDKAMEQLASGDDFDVVYAEWDAWGPPAGRFLAGLAQQAPDVGVVLALKLEHLPSALIGTTNAGVEVRVVASTSPPASLVDVVSSSAKAVLQRRAAAIGHAETLKGAVGFATEILRRSAPDAAAKSERIRRIVRWTVAELGQIDGKEFELAASLCQLGVVAQRDDADLPTAETVAAELLSKFPHLATVAKMIGGQTRDVAGPVATRALQQQDRAAIGAHLLRAALALDAAVESGATPVPALESMARTANVYSPGVLAAMITAFKKRARPTKDIALDDLEIGMLFVEDVRAETGAVVVPRGQLVTETIRARLVRFSEGRGIREPLKVQVPESNEDDLMDPEELAAAQG